MSTTAPPVVAAGRQGSSRTSLKILGLEWSVNPFAAIKRTNALTVAWRQVMIVTSMTIYERPKESAITPRGAMLLRDERMSYSQCGLARDPARTRTA